MRRANICCGGQIVDGWVNIDRNFDLHRDRDDIDWSGVIEADVREGLPFDDGELDYAVLHHALCMFTPAEGAALLAECKRALKTGGVLRLSIADIQAAIAAAERNDLAFFADFGLRATTIHEAVSEYVYLYGVRQSIVTRSIVAHMLEAAHFAPFVVAYQHTIMVDDAIIALDARPTESIWLEGIA